VPSRDLDNQPRWWSSDGFDGCLSIVRNDGGLKVWDEESGELHRELEGSDTAHVTALATYLSTDGQQPRLVAAVSSRWLLVYDPEAGSVLHRLDDHPQQVNDLACIASSSAAPHHPRIVSASDNRTAKVWDGETGGLLAVLRGHQGPVTSVAVWKEHTGGRDRIATLDNDGGVKIWDGEALTLMHDLHCGLPGQTLPLLTLRTVGGPTRLLVGLEGTPLQLCDPEEGLPLHGIIHGCPSRHIHLFESAQGRYLLAIGSRGEYHPRHPGDTLRAFLDVWDLGEAPAAEGQMRPANKHG
jgi:WD40 repeat protein